MARGGSSGARCTLMPLTSRRRIYTTNGLGMLPPRPAVGGLVSAHPRLSLVSGVSGAAWSYEWCGQVFQSLPWATAAFHIFSWPRSRLETPASLRHPAGNRAACVVAKEGPDDTGSLETRRIYPTL